MLEPCVKLIPVTNSFLGSWLILEILECMTDEQLETLVQQFSDMSQRLKEQCSYWLDAKEQLILDAEMHNKMIASLVQYAQQQQLTSAKPGSINFFFKIYAKATRQRENLKSKSIRPCKSLFWLSNEKSFNKISEISHNSVYLAN